MKTVLSWSGGKDSCVALQELRSSGQNEVAALLTTITEETEQISMHGVARSLLKCQAEALGLPLIEVLIPAQCTNVGYEAALAKALGAVRADGVEAVAFGDLFLADIREYRDALVAKNDLRSIYPVWGRDTRIFMNAFVRDGFQAVTCCVDRAVLGDAFVGRLIDDRFLADLPPTVDPCGENGEFHTFVFNGPGFGVPVPVSIGAHVVRGGFTYCELHLDHPSDRQG